MSECSFLIFDAPLPPSANAKNIVVKFGKRASIGKSKAYKDYEKMFMNNFWLACRMKANYDFSGPLCAWTVTFPARAGSDTDNYHKVLFDVLEAAGAYRNDNQIVSTHNERGPRVRGGMIRLYLCQEKHRAELARRYWDDFTRLILPYRDQDRLLDSPLTYPIEPVYLLPQPDLSAVAE